MSQPEETKARSLETWGWASILLNIALSALNLALGWASGSLAIVAEMVHNVVDLAASVGVLVGLKLSGRRSRSFPYGLHKVENVVAAGVALLIFVAAYELGRKALLGPEREVAVTWWVPTSVKSSGISVIDGSQRGFSFVVREAKHYDNKSSSPKIQRPCD
jgi:divalent metal cation (Fe/Co/Zn/Cd) transporter